MPPSSKPENAATDVPVTAESTQATGAPPDQPPATEGVAREEEASDQVASPAPAGPSAGEDSMAAEDTEAVAGPRGPRRGPAGGPAGGPVRPRAPGAGLTPRQQALRRARQEAAAAAAAAESAAGTDAAADAKADAAVPVPTETAAASTPAAPAGLASRGGQISRNAAEVPAPIDQDDYADAVALPSRRAVARAAAKQSAPRRDAFADYVPGPTAAAARLHRRHWGLIAFFFAVVLLPALVNAYYLYTHAADQYESDVGFGSRTEDMPSTFTFLGALGGSSGSSSSDMDILNQFIVSQELVSRVDAKLDLRKIYGKPTNDPYFAFPADGSIEDLVAYWQSMVKSNYDSGAGLMNLRVFAFDPQDAQRIAQVIMDESTSIINELSTTAQSDTTRYSQETLAKVEDRMASAQKALTEFRIKNHIVDAQSELAGATQIANSLVQQLASAQIDLDLLRRTLPDTDPRIAQLTLRIDVIRKRMDEENAKVGGLSDPNSPGYAKLMIDYQNLQMEQDFAQKAYLAAMSAYDQAVNDAQHKTRYLTTFLSPTLAESPTAPNRGLRVLLTLLAGFLVWSAVVMIYYALRDRR